ncbi:hypothetical protein PR202_gb01043 [Eleusine coracana subsp. coracana]|uniref:Uncharacterized protein n=1 Tax=Eleusine coracana subsp. coracana TaxID=191504 RepID=A0AAV5DWF6_ELECO|nr:hypothetical protein PR202_gb01043 [Eleusine coracana subsp. coracana]
MVDWSNALTESIPRPWWLNTTPLEDAAQAQRCDCEQLNSSIVTTDHHLRAEAGPEWHDDLQEAADRRRQVASPRAPWLAKAKRYPRGDWLSAGSGPALRDHRRRHSDTDGHKVNGVHFLGIQAWT